jgi:ketosteroid isomerase-like protein
MKTFFTLLIVTFSALGYAQTSRDEIVKTVTNLFDAMKAGDSAKAHGCFGKNAMFNTVEKDKAGKTFLNQAQLLRFLDAIGTPQKEE